MLFVMKESRARSHDRRSVSCRGLAHPCTITNGAATPFAVFEGEAPRTSTPTDFDTMFIHHIQTAALRAIRQHAQPTPSLLRRRIFALYHHQRRALLGAAAPMSQERRFIQRKPYHSVIFAVDVLPFACCTPLMFGLQITGGPGMRREE